MPAYAAQRRGSRRGGSRAAVNPEDDAEMAMPPPELSIQRQLGLAKGVPLSPACSSSGTGSPTQFDPARAAMCLLKEEDHVWTIETCMETINLLRARNNALKAQLLEVDINFADHVQARQRKIAELTEAAEGTTAIKNQLEATLEAERGDRRRHDRDQQRQREAETLAYEQTIKGLTEEVQSLGVFSGERDRANAKLAELEAANAELRDQQEIRMQSLRKKLSDFEAGKEEEVKRLVLEAKENMRDEVELAVGGAYERLVKDNQELKDKLKQLDSKLRIVLSELEHEVAAKAGLKTELEILKSLDSKSAGKIKYYMRMLKRSANELVHQCESGDGGRYPVASGDGEGPTKDMRLCRSCGGSERIVGGGKQGGRASNAKSAATSKRPGTAPAKIRRCPHGGGAGRPGRGGSSADAGKQPVFANLTTTAKEYPCLQQSSGGSCGCSSSSPPCPRSSGGCCRAISNQPASRNRMSPWGTGRRAQTATRARGDAVSIDGSNSNNDDIGSSNASSSLAVGGVKKHPARRAQTAGRCRLQSTGAASRCHPSAVTPPPHPGPPPRDGDGGRGGSVVDFAAASSSAGGGIDEREQHPSRQSEEEEELPGDRETAAAEGVAPYCRQQQTAEGRQGEEEALLAEWSCPSRSTCEAKRLSPDDGRDGNAGPRATGDSTAATTAVETGLAGDVPLERGEEGVGRESATGTADGAAVQCWRDLDAYLENRGGSGGSGGDTTGTGGTGCRPDRSATCGGTRQRSPRRPSGAHRPTFPRQYHQKVGRKRKIPSNHTGVGSPGAGDRSTDIDVDEFRSRSGSSYPRTGGRRPWTAAPHLGNSRGCGGGGEQNWWDRLARADQTKDQTKRHGGAVCGGGAEALGGELWGDADEDESRKRELFQALRVAERGGARTRNTETVDGLGEIVSGQEEFVGRHRGHAAAPVGCEGEEERLLAAVDNGDPNLLSPGRRQQQGADGRCDQSSRAARTKAELASASGDINNRLLATKPIQTVLIRERLGGVGNGSPTAPRPSEIDEVAAEEAAKAAANAMMACIATTPAAVQGKSRGSDEVAAEGLPVEAAAAAPAQETVGQAAVREGDVAAVDNKSGPGGLNQEDDMMMIMLASGSRAPADGGDEASGSTSFGMEKGEANF